MRNLMKMCSVVSLAIEAENESLATMFRSTRRGSILPVTRFILETTRSTPHIGEATSTEGSKQIHIESRNNGETQTVDPT